MPSVFGDSGSVVYVKPRPIVTSPWSSGIILGDEVGTTGLFEFDGLVPGVTYQVYQRLGATAASTDFYMGDIVPVAVNYADLPSGATVPGTTTVRFIVLNAGVPVQGAKVRVDLEGPNPMVDTALISRATNSGTTNAQGIVDLTMIQLASFTRGGVYRVVVSDPQGRRLHDRRVTVPTVSSTFAEDLPDAP